MSQFTKFIVCVPCGKKSGIPSQCQSCQYETVKSSDVICDLCMDKKYVDYHLTTADGYINIKTMLCHKCQAYYWTDHRSEAMKLESKRFDDMASHCDPLHLLIPKVLFYPRYLTEAELLYVYRKKRQIKKLCGAGLIIAALIYWGGSCAGSVTGIPL